MRSLTDEERQLVEENHNLIYSFLFKNGLSIDEWYDVVVFGLMSAAISFDSSRGKFATIAYLAMKQAVQREWRQQSAVKRKVTAVSLELPVSDNDDSIVLGDILSDFRDNVENHAFLGDVSNLTERELRVMNMFASGMTQRAIAKKLKLSQATVSRIKTVIKKKIF